jgi:DNA-binding transcriptional regulator LsrR (DeoR family)
MPEQAPDFELARQIHAVLVRHFVEGLKQSEIARDLKLSTSKVNRLISLGRRLGMVRIDIESPFQRLVELEEELVAASTLDSAMVTPVVSDNVRTTLQQVGRAAANLLRETVREGDVIAITGGRAVSAAVEHLTADDPLDVTVVPLTGGVQGKFYTDVNHLVSQMAERLGGTAMLLHAPLFAETGAQCAMLKEMASVKDVFDLARNANIALTGIGSVEPEASSYYDLNPVPEADRKLLVRMGVAAEFMAHLVAENGKVADYELNSRLVAVKPGELATGCKVIGVASGEHKVPPLHAVLTGGFLDSLVLDERTVTTLLDRMKGNRNVA